MKNIKFPLISVVLNIYNEHDNISLCLSRIRKQDYPQDKIEIIVVDDDSEDDSLKIAKKFNVRVVRSGFRNRERAKSIGIEYARGKYILLMDADVFLVSKSWISVCVNYFTKYPEVVAVQSIRWLYKKNDYAVNRYCNLFGVNDPMVFFLGKRGTLMGTEDHWPYKNTIKENGKDFFLASFTPDNLPTIGAQGYIIRRAAIYKTSWKPYFFHLDSAYELVGQGYDTFVMSKLAIEHRYVATIGEFYQKLIRNMTLYLKLHGYRKYTYKVNPVKFFFVVMLMVTVIYPLYQSVRGYFRKPDIAWFLHPLFCFTVPFVYVFLVLKYKVKTLI